MIVQEKNEKTVQKKLRRLCCHDRQKLNNTKVLETFDKKYRETNTQKWSKPEGAPEKKFWIFYSFITVETDTTIVNTFETNYSENDDTVLNTILKFSPHIQKYNMWNL